jgi:ABC-type dipeptide/oligopeptide/nickel transport system ATPase component
MSALLEVRDLGITFGVDPGGVRAVNGISFDVNAHELVALVGESGCGKSATALSLLRLLPPNAMVDASAHVLFDGQPMLSLGEPAIRTLRGRRLSMIFQEPASALNPLMSVGTQIADVAMVHGERSRAAARSRAIRMLDRMGLPDAELYARRLPHELSGGQRQRVLIAMALLLEPALVIADEPTSALDMTVQAQILNLLRELQRETGAALLLITHDFGVVSALCSRVLVMQRGAIVEDAPVEQAFASPAHPHTAALVRAVPTLAARQ